jgi:hypothetical protein
VFGAGYKLGKIYRDLNMHTLYLVEFWMDEAGIDASVWATATGGTGVVAWGVTNRQRIALSAPAAGGGDTARLRSVQRWAMDPSGATYFGTNSIARKLVLEFEALLTSVANHDNTAAIIGGLTTGDTDTRASNDIAAFILNADALEALTDNGGVETTTAVAGITLTDYNKYRIEARSGNLEFYVNESLVARHTANLPPAGAYYIQFFTVNEATGAAALYIGPVRCWIEDVS